MSSKRRRMRRIVVAALVFIGVIAGVATAAGAVGAAPPHQTIIWTGNDKSQHINFK